MAIIQLPTPNSRIRQNNEQSEGCNGKRQLPHAGARLQNFLRGKTERATGAARQHGQGSRLPSQDGRTGSDPHVCVLKDATGRQQERRAGAGLAAGRVVAERGLDTETAAEWDFLPRERG